MKKITRTLTIKISLFISISLWILGSGCGTRKEDQGSSNMQNLTARYNILYNARLLLEESRQNIEDQYYDDYSRVLSVYKEPNETTATAETGNLDSVIRKANTIVNAKSRSNYVDDAYFIIGEANYLKANFFDASEFFSYVFKNYPQETDLKLASLAWKTRALLQLNYPEEASATVDSLRKYIPSAKRSVSEAWAACAQFLISTGKEREAIEPLINAIGTQRSKQLKNRWTYILAQLQERNGQPAEAYNNYRKVVRSNASFEMAFNAGLNQIRMEDEQKGNSGDRIGRLRALLKSEKNREFNDQIYYRIGDVYQDRQQMTEAIESYQQAVRHSVKNQTQKGLAYLRLADIYFRSGNYTRAKAYYDSTVTALPPSFPDYDQIRLKAANLQLLASRYRVIGREDTLQILARMPGSEREERIDALVREQTQRTIDRESDDQNADVLIAGLDNPGTTRSEGKFYFNNAAAISQGFSGFLRRWGNRPNNDNWRRGSKTSSDITETTDNEAIAGTQTTEAGTPSASEEQLRNAYLKDIPLTNEALRLSNERIAGAYYDIATFYKDELKDNKEAIRTFEELLERVPESGYKLPVYYNLYLLYAQENRAKSEEYRNILLTRFPDSPFAKVILDPQYGREPDGREQALHQAYTNAYDLYTRRNYQEVIKLVEQTEQQYSNNPLSPQLVYLHALATGHTGKLPPFEDALKALADSFPADRLVTPLVRQHLQYIQANRDDFVDRPTALLDYDPENNIFMEPEALVTAKPTVAAPPVQKKPDAPATATQPKEADKAGQPGQAPPVTSPEPATAVIPSPADSTSTPTTAPERPSTPPVFSLPDTAEYYFVVNVLAPGINLSPSRFGIGQFNRSRYSGPAIKHQLKAVNNENQLIVVGPFYSLREAKDYENRIMPLIKDIMKIPAERYNTFVANKETLDKLDTRAMINSYVEFYQNNK